jgi:hypothetical protein
MNGSRVFNMSTKVVEGGDPKTTVCTVILDGATDDQIINLAMRQLRVDLAVGFRKNGIPSTFKYELRNHGSRGQVTMNAEQIANAAENSMTAEQQMALVARLKVQLGLA